MSSALDHVAWALSHPQWLTDAQRGSEKLLAHGRGAVVHHVQALKAKWCEPENASHPPN
jgi:hypothetical protein